MSEEQSINTLKESTNDSETVSDKETEIIVITVGKTSVKVNREKLIKASDYFKALFEGDFADSKKKEVDISEVVNSADILKDVDAFVSRGDTAIEPSNIEDLLKLSTYFQFHSLLKRCGNYINDTLTVETSLSYFILSKAYNLTEAETAPKRLLKARFHDYILHQESTLDISPVLLADFCESGYFTFCEVFSLLKFISQWVCRGLSKDHVRTGLKVLRYIDGALLQAPLHVSVQVQFVGKILVDLENASKCNEEVSELLRHLEKTINNVITKAGRVNLDGNESVLLTVSSRKSAPTKSGAVDKRTLHIYDGDIDVSEMQVLDICVYEPRCQIWYRLVTLHRDWIKSLQQRLRRVFLQGNFVCDIVMFENKILLIGESYEILSFDLETCVWSGKSYNSNSVFYCEMLQEIERRVKDGHDCTLNVLKGDLYLLYTTYDDSSYPQYSDIILEKYNKQTRLFENIRRSSIEIYDEYDDDEEDEENSNAKNLCLLTLGQLSRKSKRLLPMLLNDHDDLLNHFTSCVGDSEQPRVVFQHDFTFSCCSKRRLSKDKVHYKINDIGAIETDKKILFVAVEDSIAEASKSVTTELDTESTVRNIVGMLWETDDESTEENTGSTIWETDSESTEEGDTGSTLWETEDESTGEDTGITIGENDSESAVVATGYTTGANELDTETEKFHVIGEYDLETRKIKLGKSVPKEDINVICFHMKAERDNKCSKTVRSETFGGQNGFWRIKTASNGASCCYNVTSEEFKVTQHVPPPFSHIIAGCETELPRKLLATLKPINYMSEKS